jgi:Sec-independent protein translocase protein TatA
MFGLGMMEIGLIIALAVMLFPPTELPKLARSVARIYGQVRKTAEDFRSTILEDEDLRSPIDEIKGAYNDARWEVRDAERKARQQLAKAQMDLRMATARRLQSEREQEVKDGAAPATAVAQPAASASASSASPVRIAAADDESDESDDSDDADTDGGGAQQAAPAAPDDEEVASGPVAAPDPRVLAARRPPAYTPPTTAADGVAGDSEANETGEPREGVA